jgi:hypothetical protein
MRVPEQAHSLAWVFKFVVLILKREINMAIVIADNAEAEL